MDTEKIQLALDTMACALADHNHQWSKEDRFIYESAIAELETKDTVDDWSRCYGV